MFVVCQALVNQGPLDVNGFPAGGVRLDDASCRNEIVQLYDQMAQDRAVQLPDFSNPNVCSRMSMIETGRWELSHPGWYVKRVNCPHPDGTFPGDTNV